MKKLQMIFIISIIFLLKSIEAYAQIRPNSISLGGYIGIMVPDISYKIYSPYAYESLHPGGFSFAGDFEYHTSSPKVGIQIISIYNLNKVDSSLPFYTFYNYGNLIYHSRTEKKIVPYVSAGAGLVYMDLDGEDENAQKWRFALNYGAGSDFFVFIKPNCSIRIDARFHHHKLSNKDWDTSTVKFYYLSRKDFGWIWYFQLTAGFRYYW